MKSLARHHRADEAGAPVSAPSVREVLRVNIITGRAKARLSQHDLAERSGVSRPTISRIERAQVDVGIDAVSHIAAALGVAVSELFAIWSEGEPGEAELLRRASADDNEFVDAGDLLAALDEANAPERYSRAGRPPLAR